MELRIPTLEQLREIYRTDMKDAFPPAELKSLSVIEHMWKEGAYKPYCLFDDDGAGPVGLAFLWMGHPGWALLDYLCVTAAWRNDGFGTEILRLLPEAEPDAVIFAEVEDPVYAPDPAVAERRMDFYKRSGYQIADYDADLFGVRYQTLYFSKRAVTDEEVMKEHRFIYQSSFPPEKYGKYVRIPADPDTAPGEQIPWDQ